MIHQPVGRNQNSVGCKVKTVFQITLVLIICIWSFHQITNSHYKTLENKLKYGSADLGRRGNAGLAAVVVMDFHDGGVTIRHGNIEDGVNAEEKSQDDSSEVEDLYKEIPDKEIKENGGYRSIEFDDENGIPPDGDEYVNVASNETRSVGLPYDENVLSAHNRTEVGTKEAEELDGLSQSYGRADNRDGERPGNEDVLGERESESDEHNEASENMAEVGTDVDKL